MSTPAVQQTSDPYALQLIAKADHALNFKTNTYLGRAAEATAQTLSYPVLSVASLLSAVVLSALAVITASTLGAVSKQAQDGIVKPLFREAEGAAVAASKAFSSLFSQREESQLPNAKPAPAPVKTGPKTWKELANQKIDWVKGKYGEAMESPYAKRAFAFSKAHKRELQGAAALLAIGTAYYGITSYMGWSPISNLQDQIMNLWNNNPPVDPPVDPLFSTTETCPNTWLARLEEEGKTWIGEERFEQAKVFAQYQLERADVLAENIEPGIAQGINFVKERHDPVTYTQSGGYGILGLGLNRLTGNRLGYRNSISLGSLFSWALNPSLGKQTAGKVVDYVKANTPTVEEAQTAAGKVVDSIKAKTPSAEQIKTALFWDVRFLANAFSSMKANAPEADVAAEAAATTAKTIGNAAYCPAITELGGRAMHGSRWYLKTDIIAHMACLVFNHATALDPIGSLGKLAGLTSK